MNRLHSTLARLSMLLILAIPGAVVCLAQAAIPQLRTIEQSPSTFTVGGLGNSSFPLDGPWQFHLGDDRSFADPSLDDRTGHNGWEQLAADKPWGAQGHPGYTGYAWYRRHIRIDGATGRPKDLALLIYQFDGAYEIYWNGIRVGGLGKLPPHPVWYPFDPAHTYGLGPMRDGVLAIRVFKAPLETLDTEIAGGFTVPPVLGTPNGIAAAKDHLDYAWLRGQQFTFALDGLYALVMLLSLLVWLRNQQDHLFLWLAMYCVAPLVLLPLTGLHLGVSQDVFISVIVAALGLSTFSLWFLLLGLLELRGEVRLARITLILAWSDGIAYALHSIAYVYRMMTGQEDRLFVTVDWATGAAYSALAVYPVVIVVSAVILRRRLDMARWIVAVCAALAELIPTLSVALSEGNRYTHWTIGKKLDSPLFSIGGNQFAPETIASTLLLFALVNAAYRYARQASHRRSKLEQDLKSARELQQFLIPVDIPEIPGLTLTSAYKPAQEVGGDFFQIIPLKGTAEEDSILIVLGDVSGKGLRAAMAVSLIVGMIRILVRTSASPAELLVQLNKGLHERLQGGFATCIAVRLDSDGNCIFASAGHPAPFLNGRELDVTGAFPLGLFPSVDYEEFAFVLHPDDRLALFTDGLLEARNRAGELYGFDRLHTLFTANVDAAQAANAAIAFGQDDDITVLTLTMKTSGRSATA